MSERDDDFLSRWSRRKAEARGGGLRKKQPGDAPRPGRMRTDAPQPKQAGPAADADAGTQQEQPAREAALKDEQPAAPPEARAAGETGDMDAQETDPSRYEDFDFESLNYASDYTQFMKKGVPDAVRRRALRMLWQSNPVLANIDGLNDYDEDFTDAAMVVKTFSSAYKPGSGYLSEEERLASYSDEARAAGSGDDAGGGEIEDADADVDDTGDGEDESGEVRTALAGPDGDGEDAENDDREESPGQNRTG